MTRLTNPATWIVLAASLAGPLSLLTSRGVAPLFVVAALIAGGLMVYRDGREAWRGVSPVLWILLAFFAWSVISIGWSIDPQMALRGCLKLAGNLGFGAILLIAVRRHGAPQEGFAAIALGLGWGFTLLLLFAEPLANAPISRMMLGTLPDIKAYGFFWLKACASLLCLLVWPITLIAWRRRRTAIAVVMPVAAFSATLLVDYRSGALALVAGSLAAVFAALSRRITAAILAATMVAGILTIPWVMPPLVEARPLAGLSESAQQAATHRLYIWKFAAENIAQRPLLGWGMNASRVLPGGKEQAVDPVRGKLGEQMPLHPHNFALQVWLELGLPGILLGLAFLLGVVRRLSRPDIPRAVAAVAYGQGVTMLVIAGFSFSLWQSWWLASLWLAAAMTALMAREPAAG